MKRTKFKISILALALTFILSVASFFAINFSDNKSALASGTVSITSSSIFNIKGASIIVDRQTTTVTDDKGEEKEKTVDYTMFQFGYNDDSISLKKHLAYNWYEQSYVEVETDNEEGGKDKTKEKGEVVHGLFNMEIGFKREKDSEGKWKNLPFEKFVVTFESQSYTKNEDGKSVNYIMFFPIKDSDFVNVLITDNKDATVEDLESDAQISRDHIHIRFVEKLEGQYRVIVSEDPEATTAGANAVEGYLENVSGNYAKFSSSSTNPLYPLGFSADFGENREDKDTALMVLYCLNNQKFEVNGATESGSYYAGGSVTDNTPAVICLNKEISHLEKGGKISFDYQEIDVLRSSPSSTLYYYMLTYEDALNGEIDFGNNEDERSKEVKDDILLDAGRKEYLPEIGKDGGAGFGNDEKFEVEMAVKVYALVKDTGTSQAEESVVFLDWYIADDLKLNIGAGEKKYGFIAVGDDIDGVTFNTEDADKSWNDIVTDYQAKVDEAAKDLSAGSSSYFYLPSAESLFVDNATKYSGMKISIYYYSSSKSSNTSLASNNLSINVTTPGSYRFTLYATDAEGNDMYYIDSEGERVEFTANEIWEIYDDEDRHDYLPWFEFKVDYKGVEFKEVPGKQSTAYVGTSYTSASFDINGVANSYDVNYRLFRFESAKYYTDTLKETGKGVTFTYEEFIEVMDELYETSRPYFTEIKEVNESDEDYETFKDYNWSNSSTSFTPLDGNAIYYMRAEVTDKQYNTDPVTCSLAVQASVEAKALKGDSEWLQNNVASIILLSVAGVSLIAIILLLVIKPKNKEDIDVQYERMSVKKTNKKK